MISEGEALGLIDGFTEGGSEGEELTEGGEVKLSVGLADGDEVGEGVGLADEVGEALGEEEDEIQSSPDLFKQTSG